MRQRMLMIAGGVMLAGTMVVGEGRAADAPAALILDYSGPPKAGLDAYSEIPAGSEIGLGPHDRLLILHYRSCRQVAVTGGKIMVAAQDLNISGAQQSQDTVMRCPQEIKIPVAGGPNAGALIMAPRLDCVVVGGRKAEVGGIEVKNGDSQVLSIPVQGYRLIAAPAAPELQAGHSYTVVVKAIGGAEMVRATIDVGAERAGRTCLLRVD